ncbi:FAD/NAD(P)-binding protein [Rhizobium sp. CFBP 8762]|uniref:FAD/NAD(P)-binding protein n=1 Tax=Rhizobium sp. CFBP 8762 TaxID=2775279 RepID=UPI0017873A66|nr:FAD/NAD(P)-binding protein [Rhizobium sp. CFBP 8762]MBD8554454.1 FAD/NAD(P)-binding protein [Rhizobium sp. CFBP 8762]
MYDVAIVGSGFSAIAESIHFLRLLPPSASIVVVGDDPGFGRGTAYRTELHVHRLNVAAGRMSIFPDEPDDFCLWLREQNRDVPQDGFASRDDFGRYLRDRLAGLLRNRENRPTLHFIKAKAKACDVCTPERAVFQLDNGRTLEAANVVLCLGVGNAELPVEPSLGEEDERVVRNPWRLGWLSHVGATDRICILGSGLTMVDQVLALRAHGHRGQIEVLSRRGLVAHPHLESKIEPVAPDLPPSREISHILAALRQTARTSGSWRGVMDGLRPLTQGLWQDLSRAQRSRFLRHGLAWWNIHRHRLAPEVSRQLETLLQDGTLNVHKGFLQTIEPDGEHLSLSFRPRGAAQSTTLNADWVINCTGMERAGIAHSPLLRQMRDDGLIASADLGLGICVDRDSRVLNAEKEHQPNLFAVGALTAGQFWEITAVPDIRVQAKKVAEAISHRIHASQALEETAA